MSGYCTECGMLVGKGEFHPYAACLMFMGCRDSETVRANLAPLAEYKQRAEAAETKLRELEIRPKNLFNEDVYVMPINPLQICSQTSTAPKQEEK